MNWRRFFHRAKADAEQQQELDFYVDVTTEEYIALGMDPDVAYQVIHDELALDGNPILNLATFVTTWMDEHADRLLVETANKNAIDWDEYPQTVEIQDRCVNMLARLFGASEHHESMGTATVGSSEAIHLAGLAMKWRWRNARQAASSWNSDSGT